MSENECECTLNLPPTYPKAENKHFPSSTNQPLRILDFGTVTLGKKLTKPFEIRNTSKVNNIYII